jgi:hypothetical protein
VKVTIGGISQLVTSVSPTLIQVDIVELNSGFEAEELEILLQEGVVNGYQTLLPGVIFSPKLMTLSITQGVQEGTTLIATIIGAGVNDNIRLHRE